MELTTIKSNDDKKRFIKFYKEQYINNSKTRDSLSMFLKDLLNGKSSLCKSIYLEPLMVIEKGNIIMLCILVHAERMSDVLQISFFESSLYKPEAFKLIVDRANSLAKEKGSKTISGSLNIHVNYGLGFLASDYDKNQSFGMPYNLDFYNKYFEDNGFKSIDLVSYKKEMSSMDRLLSDGMKKRLGKRYTVRTIDFKNFEEEINLYTRINNKAFKEHIFYYKRNPDEDMELFKDLKFLLKEENLLFVEKEGVPVGFMLWYPDFYEIMKPGTNVGLITVIKNKLFSKRIKTFKIVEIGIVPSERDRGAILALFEQCFQITKGRFENFESSWVLRDNSKSKAFGIKWADTESKKYKGYVKELI